MTYTGGNEIKTLAAFLYVRGLVAEDLDRSAIQSKAELVVESLQKLNDDLNETTSEITEEALQSIFYEAGKLHFSSELRWWFQVLYQVFFKQNDGPRLGQFTMIVTVDWVTNKIYQTLCDPWIASV